MSPRVRGVIAAAADELAVGGVEEATVSSGEVAAARGCAGDVAGEAAAGGVAAGGITTAGGEVLLGDEAAAEEAHEETAAEAEAEAEAAAAEAALPVLAAVVAAEVASVAAEAVSELAEVGVPGVQRALGEAAGETMAGGDSSRDSMMLPLLLRRELSCETVHLASPRSASFRCPAASSSKLSGLMSLCA